MSSELSPIMNYGDQRLTMRVEERTERLLGHLDALEARVQRSIQSSKMEVLRALAGLQESNVRRFEAIESHHTCLTHRIGSLERLLFEVEKKPA